jgi:DNA-binding NarL/FixJ family response regulator
MPPPSAPIAETVGPLAPIGVLVIDEQRAVREGLARLIACAQIPLRCVCTAATGTEALSAVALLHPEVVVLDVDLGGEDGLMLLPQLSLTASVLVLTSHGDEATRARATRLGARAFIEKHQPAAELLGSIVAMGHLHMRGEKAPDHQGTSSLQAVTTSSAVLPRPNP